MNLLVLVGLIIAIIYFTKKKEHEEYLQKLEENRQFSLSCTHQGNRNLLKKCGEENFIKYFGKEQYDQVKNGTDTEIVQMLKEYRDQL